MAQQPGFQVCLSAVRVDQLPGGIPGHRVDRQVPAGEVFLKRNRRVKIH